MDDVRRHIKICLSCAADTLADDFLALLENQLLQINEELAKLYGFHFDLDHWQKTISTGMGAPRVQDRLNERIFDKANIYLGIFWTRHGTPPGRTRTGRIYGSGCEEEYYRAKSQLPGDNVWVFFSDCPVQPSKVDPQQLKQARLFKTKVRDEKVEYIDFGSKEEFVRKFRIHVNNWLKTNGAPANDSAPTARPRAVAKKSDKKDFQKFNKGF